MTLAVSPTTRAFLAIDAVNSRLAASPLRNGRGGAVGSEQAMSAASSRPGRYAFIPVKLLCAPARHTDGDRHEQYKRSHCALTGSRNAARHGATVEVTGTGTPMWRARATHVALKGSCEIDGAST